MGSRRSGPVPTEVLVSDWGLDAAALIEALRPAVGTARLFLAGALADDLGVAEGPAEIVALADGTDAVADTTVEPGALIPCAVPLRLTVLPVSVVRAWSGPLLCLLTDPPRARLDLPPVVATGLHALYTQRDLVLGADHLAADVEEAHAEVLPMYLATRELHRLHRLLHDGCPPEPRTRLRMRTRALLGAWGYCNPRRHTVLPLFERAAHRLRLAPALTASVRQGLTDRTADAGPALRALDEIAATDPMLRLCGELAGLAGAAELAELAPTP